MTITLSGVGTLFAALWFLLWALGAFGLWAAPVVLMAICAVIAAVCWFFHVVRVTITA